MKLGLKKVLKVPFCVETKSGQRRLILRKKGWKDTLGKLLIKDLDGQARNLKLAF